MWYHLKLSQLTHKSMFLKKFSFRIVWMRIVKIFKGIVEFLLIEFLKCLFLLWFVIQGFFYIDLLCIRGTYNRNGLEKYLQRAKRFMIRKWERKIVQTHLDSTRHRTPNLCERVQGGVPRRTQIIIFHPFFIF